MSSVFNDHVDCFRNSSVLQRRIKYLKFRSKTPQPLLYEPRTLTLEHYKSFRIDKCSVQQGTLVSTYCQGHALHLGDAKTGFHFRIF